jgi:hypothetical protein
MEVLLIEPNHRNKYPPLGLMKLSTFHKKKGDKVEFFKGKPGQYHQRFGKEKQWGRIYVSAVFTFEYKHTIQAIELAKRHARYDDVFVGGTAATLLKSRLSKDTNVNIVEGLLNEEGKIRIRNDSVIDNLIPDYSMLDDVEYKYPTQNAYIGYATRGCVHKCEFCAVPKIEPEYCHYKDLTKYVRDIEGKFGEKKDLLLMDNNVLASNKFKRIINDIIDLGFERDAKFKGKNRFVDFNQGLDSRLMDEKKVKLLSKIAIKPARIAFDHIRFKKMYSDRIRLAAKYGVTELSNFLLFNWRDKPSDLYERIMINIDLNEELNTSIYSFPMKFIPLDAIDRSFVGKNWTKKQLRGVQVILNATHGVVGPKRPFVERAFGHTPEEFDTLLWMPEEYLMFREKHEKTSAREWKDQFESLRENDGKTLKKIVENNQIDVALLKQKGNPSVKEVLKHYGLLRDRTQSKIEYFPS